MIALDRQRLKRFFLCRVVKKSYEQIEIYLTRNDEDIQKALLLVYEKYKKRGLLNITYEEFLKKEIQSVYKKNMILGIAQKNNTIIATTSLIEDDPVVGLPSDIIYKKEIDNLRKQGRKVVEFARLASKEEPAVLLRVFRILYRYAKLKKATDIVISVAPRHYNFYKDFLGFEQIGGLQNYPGLENAPAYLARLDLTRIENKVYKNLGVTEEGKRYCDFFFKKRLPEDKYLEKFDQLLNHYGFLPLPINFIYNIGEIKFSFLLQN